MDRMYVFLLDYIGVVNFLTRLEHTNLIPLFPYIVYASIR